MNPSPGGFMLRPMRSLLPLALALLLHAAAANAEPYAVGDTLAGFSLEDQFGRAHRLDAEVAVLVFSRDMDGGALIKDALSDRDAADLQRLRAVYIADISGMPSLIARLFALPRMRNRAYPMLLDRDGAATRGLPDIEKHATLIFLDALRVVRIEHYDTAEALDRALAELPEGS